MQESPFFSLPVSADEIHKYILRNFYQSHPKGNLFQKLLINSIMGLIRKLPWNIAYFLGVSIGKGLFHLRIRGHVAMVNLDIAYGDTKSKKEKIDIYKKSMINFGNVVINYIRLPVQGEDFWRDHCTLINEDILKVAINKKKGVVFIGGHIGMWDLAGGKVGMAGYPISVLAKGIKNPVINEFVYNSRLSMNMGGIANKNTMEQILSGIRRGDALVTALDQNMSKSRGVFIDWMGKKASSVKSIAYIIRETGAAVMPGFMIQRGPKDFAVILADEVPWQSFPEDLEKELFINIQHHSDAVEKIVLEYPELWFWIHKRWKIRPDGEPDPYKKKKKG